MATGYQRVDVDRTRALVVDRSIERSPSIKRGGYVLIALGIIALIGSLVATGYLYAQLGNTAFTIGWGGVSFCLLSILLSRGFLTSTITTQTPLPYLEEVLPPIPPSYLPYSTFKEKFSLGETSTEKDNPQTANLSQTMLEDRHKGLSILLNEEKRVVAGFKEFASRLDLLAPVLAEKTKQGGRIIFVGVGSSGRAGIELAAQMRLLCPEIKCLGMIGGGDCALIQAREGFEDSPEQGGLAAAKLNLTPQDSIFLISASGSASFNAGFGHAAADTGSIVYCFYNSTEVPARTSELFKRPNNPVVPLLIDIGPQAILGSTRLQGYSIARVCLAYLLGQTVCQYDPKKNASEFSMKSLSAKLEGALEQIKTALPDLLKIIDQEYSVFSSPHSNFRRVRDETNGGNATLLGTRSSIRGLIIDSVETSPTFFLNPRKRETESQKRRAEYQAYLVGEPDNHKAWHSALGRDPYFKEDLAEIDQFILSAEVDGNESFANRPHGPDNVVIGVEVLRKGEVLSPALIASLTKVKKAGGNTALIVISEDPQPHLREDLSPICDIISLIDTIEDDPLGLTFSQLLKWECNLISNGTMILMGKVLGNQMIDMRTSNNKLIDRCMRLINKVWIRHHPKELLDQEKLYQHVTTVYEQQKVYQSKGDYTPSTLKIVLTMLKKKLSFENAILHLQEIKENIDLLF